MNLLLRKVDNLNRMDHLEDCDWLTNDDVPGVMVREFAPRHPAERGISVWQLKEDKENLYDIITAIALAPKRRSLDPIQYLTFPGEIIADCQLRLKQTTGLTLHTKAADFHHEILGLTALKVGKLTHEACTHSAFQSEKLSIDDVLDRIVEIVLQDESILDRVGRSSPIGEQILDRVDGR